MDLKIYWTFLPHTDPDASLAFYRDILGFEVRNDVRYDGMAWLTLGHPDQPGTSLVLEPPFADPSITEDERRMIGEMMAKGTFSRVVFSTSNVDATFEQLQAAGVDVVQEPMDQPYGVRDCARAGSCRQPHPDQPGGLTPGPVSVVVQEAGDLRPEGVLFLHER